MNDLIVDNTNRVKRVQSQAQHIFELVCKVKT